MYKTTEKMKMLEQTLKATRVREDENLGTKLDLYQHIQLFFNGVIIKTLEVLYKFNFVPTLKATNIYVFILIKCAF